MGPGVPIWAAEETEGQLSWVPGSFRDDSRAGLGNLDLKELPTEICFLSTRTGIFTNFFKKTTEGREDTGIHVKFLHTYFKIL